jgi:hypothetical protein
MVETLLSDLLSIGAVLLANGRTGCVQAGTSTHPSHPHMVVKWTAGGGGAVGSESRGTKGRLAMGEQQVGTGGGGEWKGQQRRAGQN